MIWVEFAQMANILEKELEVYSPLKITGEVPQEQREERVKKFSNNKDNKVFICTSAGGFGLNLQVAEFFIFYSLPYSLSKKLQAEDRIHRIGQTSNVVIYALIARGTIDEFVRKTLHRKNRTADEIFEGIKELLK